MILRKLLASSSLAIAGTLEAMRSRLLGMRDEKIKEDPDFIEALIRDEDIESDLLDEILEPESSEEEDTGTPPTLDRQLQGQALDQETCEKLFACAAQVDAGSAHPENVGQRLAAESARHAQATLNRSLEQNNQYFNEAREKLEKWADDMVLAAEKALKDTKEQIKLLQRQARQATHLEEQHEVQQRIQKLEKQQRRQRQEIFQVEDEIMEKRDSLIGALERRLTQKTDSERLFTVSWSVV